jgi:hypothetical protein
MVLVERIGAGFVMPDVREVEEGVVRAGPMGIGGWGHGAITLSVVTSIDGDR